MENTLLSFPVIKKNKNTQKGFVRFLQIRRKDICLFFYYAERIYAYSSNTHVSFRVRVYLTAYSPITPIDQSISALWLQIVKYQNNFRSLISDIVVVERAKNTFKNDGPTRIQINVDHQGPIQLPNISHIPDTPFFSLVTTSNI